LVAKPRVLSISHNGAIDPRGRCSGLGEWGGAFLAVIRGVSDVPRAVLGEFSHFCRGIGSSLAQAVFPNVGKPERNNSIGNCASIASAGNFPVEIVRG